jgi:protein-disulfide isomerase
MRATIRAAVLLSIPAFLACGSTPAAQSQQDVESLKKEIASLKKDIAEIKDFLKAATGGRFGAPKIEDMSIDLSGAAVKGQPNAPVTLVEVSDYHCPFCKRHFLTTQPQIDAQYVNTGKVRHVFIHLPIDQLHPDAFRSHEAAVCAAEQGKFWELHAKLFQTPVRTNDEILGLAQTAGVDRGKLEACMTSGKYKAAVRESVAKMGALGVGSTPMFLVGKTPAAGKPMEIDAVVEGAHPFETFKSSLDAILGAR